MDYDLDNRIIKVDVDNDDVDYRYDALGRRVIRQEGTTKTALIWWGNSECAEHKHQAGQTVIQNDIMSHPSRLNSVIARAVDGSKFKLEWYHKNYLDHVYAVSDDSGDILEHYRYTAFGEVQIYNASGNQVATTQIDNHILWNTRRRDELTGFYMYKFRHYSAELGRWLGRDPIEEDGGDNLYGFVENNSLNEWDYLGNIGFPCTAAQKADCRVACAATGGTFKDCHNFLCYHVCECNKPKPKPKKKKKPKKKTCKPCLPGVGSRAYRYDTVPPSRVHAPCPGNHIHWYKVSQRPVTAKVAPCKCEWVKDKARGHGGVECDNAGAWVAPAGIPATGDRTPIAGGGVK